MSSREPDIHAVQTGAHLIILRMLVMRELERDPQFAAQARVALDRALGKELLEDGTVPDEATLAQICRIIRDMFDDAERQANIGRHSLRRRFLNWLHRGA